MVNRRGLILDIFVFLTGSLASLGDQELLGVHHSYWGPNMQGPPELLGTLCVSYYNGDVVAADSITKNIVD